jgi:hypothetical protein
MFAGQLGYNFNTGSSFSPLSLPDLWAWLPGGNSNFVLSGNNITQWTDQSGNENDFFGSPGSYANLTTGSPPELPINGINVGFYQTDSTLISEDTPGPAPSLFAKFSIFSVVYNDDPGSSQQYSRIIEQRYDTSFFLGADVSGASLQLIVGDSGPGTTCVGGSLSTGVATVVSGIFDGTTGYLYQNGIEVASGSTGFNAPSGSPQFISIGKSNVFGGSQWNGGIGEIIICTTNLNGTSYLSSIHNYLLTKYNI